MKKAILILGAAFIFAGCNQEQGGTGDTSTTGSGSSNAPSSRVSSRSTTNTPSVTDTNQIPKSTP
jgi:predicted small secreted protein